MTTDTKRDIIRELYTRCWCGEFSVTFLAHRPVCYPHWRLRQPTRAATPSPRAASCL